MDQVDPRIAEAVEALRRHGAGFAYLHGSRADGTAGPDSDVDIAAYFDGAAPQAFEVLLPRVVWEATTRKSYLDELLRLTRAHREFADAVLRRGG